LSIERRLRDRHILLPHDRVWEHVRTLMRAGLAARVPGRASAGRAAARALTGMPAQVTPEVAKHLEAAGVAVKPYDVVLADVRALATAGVRIWADYAKARAGLGLAVRRRAARDGGALVPERSACRVVRTCTWQTSRAVCQGRLQSESLGTRSCKWSVLQ